MTRAVPTAVRRAEERIERGKAAVSEARARATEIAQQCAAQPRLRPNGLQRRRLERLRGGEEDRFDPSLRPPKYAACVHSSRALPPSNLLPCPQKTDGRGA